MNNNTLIITKPIGTAVEFVVTVMFCYFVAGQQVAASQGLEGRLKRFILHTKGREKELFLVVCFFC